MACFPVVTILQQLVTLLTGIQEQLVQLNKRTSNVEDQIQQLHATQTSTGVQAGTYMTESLWLEARMNDQMDNVELRQSRTWPSQGDALRHVSQEASGELWGSSPECLQMVARLLVAGIYSRGHFPVSADKMRGQFYACQAILQREGLLASDEKWSDGTVACAMAQMQDKICQESGGSLTPAMIDRHIGVSADLRLEINQACATARPRSHMEGHQPIAFNDPEYLSYLEELLPRHKIQAVTGFMPR